MNENYIFIGIDPHKEKHMAVIIRKYDEIYSKIEISNNMKSFDKLIDFVDKRRKDLIPIYGIENAYGYGRSLSIYLTQKGYIVKDINPSYAKSFRNNAPTTKKNDVDDALCVANILYLKHEQLNNANHIEVYHVLSQLVRRRETIVVAQKTLKNQLHEQLVMSYPDYKKMFSEIDGDTALFFWDKYPTMNQLVGESMEELAKGLRLASHNSCSTKKAKQIMSIIESQGDINRKYEDYNKFIIKGLVADIKYKNKELEEMKVKIRTILDRLGFKLESMSGIDTIMSGKLIAEIGDINRFNNASKLARYAGIAPVKFSSGGKGKDRKSHQGNRRLNSIFYFLALQMIQVSKKSKIPRNESFYKYYNKKKLEGKTNKEAITCVQRRLVGVIYGMLKNKTEYNPNIANKSIA